MPHRFSHDIPPQTTSPSSRRAGLPTLLTRRTGVVLFDQYSWFKMSDLIKGFSSNSLMSATQNTSICVFILRRSHRTSPGAHWEHGLLTVNVQSTIYWPYHIVSSERKPRTKTIPSPKISNDLIPSSSS